MNLLTAIEGHVGVVTLQGAPHNFVSSQLMTALAGAFSELDADPDVRAILLKSDGASFCAGADLGQHRTAEERRAEMTALYAAGARLFSCETPVVAAIQGPAVGAGLGLALVADFRVAAPEARFVANFVKLGFHPGFALTLTLPQLIGAQRASLLLLSGRRLKAEEALAWGLVDELSSTEELAERALSLAAEIAENAPLAVRETRRTLRRDLADQVAARTGHELERQLALMETEDFAEGVRAVTERRAGRFSGR